MGDPQMTDHLGGPETPEKIRQRHERSSSFGEEATHQTTRENVLT